MKLISISILMIPWVLLGPDQAIAQLETGTFAQDICVLEQSGKPNVILTKENFFSQARAESDCEGNCVVASRYDEPGLRIYFRGKRYSKNVLGKEVVAFGRAHGVSCIMAKCLSIGQFKNLAIPFEDESAKSKSMGCVPARYQWSH